MLKFNQKERKNWYIKDKYLNIIFIQSPPSFGSGAFDVSVKGVEQIEEIVEKKYDAIKFFFYDAICFLVQNAKNANLYLIYFSFNIKISYYFTKS